MATLREMADRVIDATGRAPNSHLGEAKKLVNEAYFAVCERSRLNTKTVTLNLTATVSDYTLSTDFGISDLVNVRSITYTLQDDVVATPLEPVTFDQIAAYRQGNQATNSLGLYYTVWGEGNLGLWPGPTTSDSIALTYDFRPAPLTLDSDEPDAIPVEFHYVIEDGAIARSARYKPALMQLATASNARYQQGLAELRRHVNKRYGAMPRQAVVGRKRHFVRRGNSIVFSGDE